MASSYSLSDVVWAIEVIDKFTTAKKKLEEFMKTLASKGVKISERDFNNPSAILPAVMQAKRMGIEFSMEELKDVLAELGDVSFSDVKKALEVLRSYHSLNREIDTTMRTIMSTSGMTLEEFGALARAFGLDIGIGISGSHTQHVEENVSVSEDELQKLEEFLQRVKSSKT